MSEYIQSIDSLQNKSKSKDHNSRLNEEALKEQLSAKESELSICRSQLINTQIALANRQNICESQEHAIELFENSSEIITQLNGQKNQKDFFVLLTTQLGSLLNLDYVMLNALLPSMQRTVLSKAFWTGHRCSEDFEYSIENSICELVLKHKKTIYVEEIQSKFPKDTILKELNVFSYLGVPIFDSKNNLVGLVSILNKSPLQNLELVKSVVNLFSLSAATELEKLGLIDQNKEIQKRLKVSQKFDSLGKLNGGIAHDLNNILGGVYGYIGLLRGKIEDEKQQKRLDKMETSLKRGIHLVSKLLNYVRQDMAVISNVISINPIITEVMDLIKASFHKKIEINLEQDEGLRPIEADPTKISQVIMNLCINARDAMEKGGVLSIRTENIKIGEEEELLLGSLKPGVYNELVIRDAGSGMSDEVLENIFKPLFTTKGDKNGTGLGLSLVHDIIIEMRGALKVETEVGKGTAFSVYFPAIIG